MAKGRNANPVPKKSKPRRSPYAASSPAPITTNYARFLPLAIASCSRLISRSLALSAFADPRSNPDAPGCAIISRRRGRVDAGLLPLDACSPGPAQAVAPARERPVAPSFSSVSRLAQHILGAGGQHGPFKLRPSVAQNAPGQNPPLRSSTRPAQAALRRELRRAGHRETSSYLPTPCRQFRPLSATIFPIFHQFSPGHGAQGFLPKTSYETHRHAQIAAVTAIPTASTRLASPGGFFHRKSRAESDSRLAAPVISGPSLFYALPGRGLSPHAPPSSLRSGPRPCLTRRRRVPFAARPAGQPDVRKVLANHQTRGGKVWTFKRESRGPRPLLNAQ
jgi:hypothetical protein